MKFISFIKNNISKLLIHILFLTILVISILSIEFSIEILQDDSKTVNYAGILRGGTQLLVKQELEYKPNDELIEELDEIIYQMKVHNEENHFAIHEDAKLQELLSDVELVWFELKEEIYKYRAKSDSKLFELSETYYDITNNFVFETQSFAEGKIDKLISLRPRLLIIVILILIIDIKQLVSKLHIQNQNEQLNNIAFIDSLTGLYNRAQCNEIIRKYNEMERLPDLACVYFDLNNLKTTNDLFGHEAGDNLILNFGKALKEASEPYGFICRNGGDEFVAIFENCTDKNIKDYLNILEEKTKNYNSKETEIQISYAVGVALTSECITNNIIDIFAIADKRMYANKAKYKMLKMQENN